MIVNVTFMALKRERQSIILTDSLGNSIAVYQNTRADFILVNSSKVKTVSQPPPVMKIHFMNIVFTLGNIIYLSFKEYSLKVHCCYCLFAKLCPTLCNPMDCSLPGSSVHGISQARVLEWVAVSFSRGSSQPRD